MEDRSGEPEYVTTEAAARYSSLSKHALAQLRSRGRGPSGIKFGAAVRYSKRDLDDWARLHRVRADGTAA